MIDLTGKRFGRLTAIRPAKKRIANGNVCWECECSCGNHTVVDGYLLRTGGTRSCGCLRAEIASAAAKSNPVFMANSGNINNLKTYGGVFKTSVVKSKKNQSGVIGVSYDKKEDLWFSRLMVKGDYVLLKGFKEFEEAVAARKQAERKYLFSKDGTEISA